MGIVQSRIAISNKKEFLEERINLYNNILETTSPDNKGGLRLIAVAQILTGNQQIGCVELSSVIDNLKDDSYVNFYKFFCK